MVGFKNAHEKKKKKNAHGKIQSLPINALLTGNMS